MILQVPLHVHGIFFGSYLFRRGPLLHHFFLEEKSPLEIRTTKPPHFPIRWKPTILPETKMAPDFREFIWVSTQKGGFPPKWMVKIMENQTL